MDYSHCTLTCNHNKLKRKNNEIPGIVRGELYFNLPLIHLDLTPNHPGANKLNSLKIAYKSDTEFCDCCDSLTMKSLYEYQQQKHIELIDILTQVLPDFHKLPFYFWDTDEAVINFITDSAREMLWHQRLIHIGQHSMKNIHLYVDRVMNLSNDKFDDITKCAICSKANFKKFPAGHTSLQESLTQAYEGLYIDFGFARPIFKR